HRPAASRNDRRLRLAPRGDAQPGPPRRRGRALRRLPHAEPLLPAIARDHSHGALPLAPRGLLERRRLDRALDPSERENRWDDPAYAGTRRELLALLAEVANPSPRHLPNTGSLACRRLSARAP